MYNTLIHIYFSVCISITNRHWILMLCTWEDLKGTMLILQRRPTIAHSSYWHRWASCCVYSLFFPFRVAIFTCLYCTHHSGIRGEVLITLWSLLLLLCNPREYISQKVEITPPQSVYGS